MDPLFRRQHPRRFFGLRTLFARKAKQNRPEERSSCPALLAIWSKGWNCYFVLLLLLLLLLLLRLRDVQGSSWPQLIDGASTTSQLLNKPNVVESCNIP
jgi:hypothetical protein